MITSNLGNYFKYRVGKITWIALNIEKKNYLCMMKIKLVGLLKPNFLRL